MTPKRVFESVLGFILLACATEQALAQGAIRSVPEHALGGAAFEAVITLNASPGVVAVGVEDIPPPGWLVSGISHGGVFDGTARTVKWGPFFAPSIPAQVSYQVTSPLESRGSFCFDGSVSFDGFGEPVQGRACVEVMEGIPTVSAWGALNLTLLLLVSGSLIQPRRRSNDAPRSEPGCHFEHRA